jgi:hypothetical protein
MRQEGIQAGRIKTGRNGMRKETNTRQEGVR